jgi:hypothetical protein
MHIENCTPTVGGHQEGWSDMPESRPPFTRVSIGSLLAVALLNRQPHRKVRNSNRKQVRGGNVR